MSANSGKVQVLGVTEAAGERVIELRFIQVRNPDWVHGVQAYKKHKRPFCPSPKVVCRQWPITSSLDHHE